MSTQFERTLMTAEIPKALSIINEAVPTLLVPFCVFILFGVFDKIAAFVSRCFGAKGPATLTFERSRLRESDEEVDSAEAGHDILQREKGSLRSGGTVGEAALDGDSNPFFVKETEMASSDRTTQSADFSAAGEEHKRLLRESDDQRRWEGAKERLSRAARNRGQRPAGSVEFGGEGTTTTTAGYESQGARDLDAIFSRLR